jgi:hypothetical protein
VLEHSTFPLEYLLFALRAQFAYYLAISQRTANSNMPPSGSPPGSGQEAALAPAADATDTAVAAASPSAASAHVPSLAGSVIEAQDVLSGNKLLIRIQNIASTANLGVKLDLKKIALKCRNTEFNPRRFGAVIMRLREPRATALIFSSGKMVVTGVKSTHNATLASKKFAYVVERVGFKPNDIIDFKVQNIVGSKLIKQACGESVFARRHCCS